MISLRPEQIGSILCIGAHADDIEIGCGGTILKLLAARSHDIDIRWAVLSGDETRRAEARAAAQSFLGKAPHRLDLGDFRDTCFPYADALDLKDWFGRLSENFRPDIVFTHFREDLHQDHRFVSELTWQHFRNHLILEYEIPKYEGDLGHPSLFVPLSLQEVEAKIEKTLSAFASQRAKPWFDADTLRAVMRLRGVECQSPSGFAEAFHCRKIAVEW